jgi:hypothetical protein
MSVMGVIAHDMPHQGMTADIDQWFGFIGNLAAHPRAIPTTKQDNLHIGLPLLNPDVHDDQAAALET